MHSWEDIEENRCFSNGGINLHIHAIAQGRPEDNQVEFIQGPHGIVNAPKNLVLNNIRRFTMEHIGAANGLLALVGNHAKGYNKRLHCIASACGSPSFHRYLRSVMPNYFFYRLLHQQQCQWR